MNNRTEAKYVFDSQKRLVRYEDNLQVTEWDYQQKVVTITKLVPDAFQDQATPVQMKIL